MYLLWLRVAVFLYAGASIAAFPAVLQGSVRWRSTCVHLGGLALLLHSVSVIEMLAQAHRWLPFGVREAESMLGLAVAGLFFLVWWLYGAISLGIFALPITFFIVFIPALGNEKYVFPSEGVRISWLVAHIVALLAAYAALGFSILASALYLVQERRLKAKPTSHWLSLSWLPPLDTLERIAHAILLFGFPCMTVGLVIGSVLVRKRLSAPPTSVTPRSSPPSSCGPFTFCCSSCAAPRACAAAGPPTLRRRLHRHAGRLGCQPLSHVHRYGAP